MTVAVNDKFGKVPWNGKHLLGSCTRSISIVPAEVPGRMRMRAIHMALLEDGKV